jgi:hypothetical protein
MAKTGRRILIALGGNAIKQAHEKGTAEEQFKNVAITAENMVKILQQLGKGERLIITHGNGPQSGNLALQQDIAKNEIPPQPLDVVGAMTQGQIGYMLQNTMQNIMAAKGMKIYRSLAEIDGPIDQVISAIPARNCPQLVQECRDRGVKLVQFFSAGFAETGDPEGIEIQNRLVEIAKGSGTTVQDVNQLLKQYLQTKK